MAANTNPCTQNHLNYLPCLLPMKYILSQDMNYGWLVLLYFKKTQSKAALLVSHTSGTFLKNELPLSWLPRLTQKHKLFNIQHQTYQGKKENTARGQRRILVTPKPEELSQSSEAAKALKRNRKNISNNTQVSKPHGKIGEVGKSREWATEILEDYPKEPNLKPSHGKPGSLCHVYTEKQVPGRTMCSETQRSAVPAPRPLCPSHRLQGELTPVDTSWKIQILSIHLPEAAPDSAWSGRAGGKEGRGRNEGKLPLSDQPDTPTHILVPSAKAPRCSADGLPYVRLGQKDKPLCSLSRPAGTN